MDSDQNQKVHRYLDGEFTEGDFKPEEIREIDLQNQIIREAQKLHRSIRVPDLTAAVMARLPAARVGRVRSLFAWMWRPRLIETRPAYGIALAAVLVLGFLWSQSRGPQETGSSAKIFIQFRIEAPQASAVHLGGSFTEWEPSYTLHELSPGIWSVLVPLDPGVYDYAFLVNGRWITDPAAPVVDDGFGGQNSRLLVVVPGGLSSL